MGHTRVKEQSLSRGRLSRINMGHDANIPGLYYRTISCHTKKSQPLKNKKGEKHFPTLFFEK
jgi:hypothetical protein